MEGLKQGQEGEGGGESTCVRTPNRRRSRKKLISTSVYTSGRAPTSPSTWPTSRSARVNVGSTCTTEAQRLVNITLPQCDMYVTYLLLSV